MNYIICDMQNFIENTKNKKILCFGSGSYFKVMCFDFYHTYPDANICGIIDNNPEKQSKIVNILSITTKIYSVESAVTKFDFSDTVILITASQLNAIKEQIDKNDKFAGCDVYSYFDIKMKNPIPIKKLSKNSEYPLIPKTIHYCWFGGNDIPMGLQKCIDSWKKYCPDYEIKRWDETNYDLSKNLFLRKAQELKKWGFVPDYARFDIIYNEGGFYFDTDVEIINNIEILRHNKGFIGTEIIGGVNGGSGFGAGKNHAALKDLMSIYEDGNILALLNETCIGRETSYFFSKGYQINGNLQNVNDMMIYPFNVLSPKIYETNEMIINDATISIHHFNGSWR